jgi:Uma2 family endonuclease
MVGPPEYVLAERRRFGLDYFDEMWDGEYHMTPPPSFEHQETGTGLSAALREFIAGRGLGRVAHDVGVRRSETDYRVPDIAVVATARTGIIREGWVDGAPDLVVEVRSPGDETIAKMPWYAALGVPELLIIERDTRHVTLYRLDAGALVAVAPDPDGWQVSARFPAAFRTENRDGTTRVAVQDRGDAARSIRYA